jgi:hypothetical protein
VTEGGDSDLGADQVPTGALMAPSVGDVAAGVARRHEAMQRRSGMRQMACGDDGRRKDAAVSG